MNKYLYEKILNLGSFENYAVTNQILSFIFEKRKAIINDFLFLYL